MERKWKFDHADVSYHISRIFHFIIFAFPLAHSKFSQSITILNILHYNQYIRKSRLAPPSFRCASFQNLRAAKCFS